MNNLPTPAASLMDPAAHDWWGASILFALAAACYVSYWIALRVTAVRNRRQQRAVAAIAFHAIAPVIPIRPAVEVEHDTCDGCSQTICRCHENDQLHDVCVDTIARGCSHGRSLCVECAIGECDECLTDARSQGVLSQYGPFARFGGAS